VLVEGGGASAGAALGTEGSGLVSCAAVMDDVARDATASKMSAGIFIKLQMAPS